ncbi:hypothetical protein P3T65_15420 [Pseudomonas nitroreducens]|uniref:hypothetical protein n=1 Tax=Pseudomonas nitroreducens TaxID=46680 RepID=UPI0023F710DF|nr:hypothetical protein [Pseudomonas nitroreducens]WEW95645.1 hypothetical protein P3T65_15420 [Pseudomonas nitroreducens]
MDARDSTDGREARGRSRGAPLGPAHRGYAYQDLVTAYLLVRSLVQRFEAVVVDRKAVDDDRFDDIEITSAGIRVRRQLKSSASADLTLGYSDFEAVNSSLRFDRLLNTFIAEGDGAADEYRLCVTWQAPVQADPLSTLLVASDDSSTFPGELTKTFRLDPNRVWPHGSEPVFASLREVSDESRVLSREIVVRFCERFVIEVSLPSASLDLERPGLLEHQVLDLLVEQVGIGRYPNGDRRAEDVAALAIHVASTARVIGATLRPSDVVQRLGLRTDFGRIAQAFPLDSSVLQERLHLRQRLRGEISRHGVHLVLAGPGAGKSWALTQLAKDLEHDGLIVARHYCFLEPGDELVERRVTTDVFFGNILGELSDAFTRHSYSPPNVFAAGLDELEAFLVDVAAAGRDLVVIVDGLDHIARVRDASSGLSDNETDIVERLATLKLPEHVTLVVGSQPGDHLDPLREAFSARVTEHEIEPWSMDEVLELALCHGLAKAFDDVHLLEEERRTEILDNLAQRSEGNPLYTRYLSRGLIDGLLAGAISDPLDWLNASPTISGNIALYYQHLYESVSSKTKAIADVLGVLDFSVTEMELREILGPLLEDWVPEALVTLSPVLTRATGQGGLRIFHESFRRFMLQELQWQGRRLANVLSPVVAWLESRDFYTDAKSYRFTLPVMRRAGRESEILQRVSASFVRDSVLNGHPLEAIERNLMLAADVAALALDWPALLRYAELSRSLASCFEDGTNNWREYWQTYVAIYGAKAVADRLLFDGRPTLSRSEGLLACECVDIEGVMAPWQEYLALPVAVEEVYSSEFDLAGPLRAHEEENLAIIRGRLRIGQRTRVVRRVHEHLCHPEVEVTSQFLRKLAKLLAEELSPGFVEKLAHRACLGRLKRYFVLRYVGCSLLLGLSDAALESEDIDLSVRHAVAAARYADSPEEAVWCIERGARFEQVFASVTPPSSLDIGLEGEHKILSAAVVREWVASVRLLAHSPGSKESLLRQKQRADGEGWYRCWLRYVLAIAQAEAAAADNQPFEIVSAFSELTVDIRPFHGSPRACDLYSVEHSINESLARGLKLLRTNEEWQHAISCIVTARASIATRFDREDGGPITAGAFFSLLLPYASTSTATGLIVETLERELADEESNGTYYSTHAEFRMRLARLNVLAERQDGALSHWHQAVTFFLGYGFHKDIALFDVIDNVPALLKHSEAAALSALVRLQPLLRAVLRHTDRRETKNMPNAWFQSLLEVNAVRAVELLCRDLIRDPGSESWMIGRAQKDVLRHLLDKSDPKILDALWETLLFEIQYDNDGGEAAEERLAPLKRMLTSDPEYAQERFVRLCAEAFDDPQHNREHATVRLRAFANQYGLVWPCLDDQPEEQGHREGGLDSLLEKSADLQVGQRLVFPASPRLVDILASLRRLSQERSLRGQLDALVAVPLSYHITEMVQRGESAQAQRLLKFFVHETPSWSYEPVHPVAALAQCLDQAGHTDLAAIAHVLTFTVARGGRGWLSFGDRSQAVVLKRAMTLDKDLALQTLAEETARKLRLSGYSGIAKHLVEQISDWGDPDMAVQAWEEAFSVLESRLPLPGRASIFEPLDVHDVIDWSIDEALATLLLVRIGNAALPRKVAALSGFSRLLHERPYLFQKPLERLLTRDTTVSTTQLILKTLLETSADVDELLRSMLEILRGYAGSDSWSLSLLAQKLLERIGFPISVSRTCSIRLEGNPSRRGVMLARYGDSDDVLGEMRHLWPELPAIVALRMQQTTVDNEAFKHYARERGELALGRRSDVIDPAPVLSWPGELFIAVLDEALMGLHEHLWRQGEWDPEIEDNVLDCILPFVRLSLALDASRVPRPNWPFANEAQNQLSDMVRVPEGDPTYGCWVRLAMQEHIYHRSDNRRHMPPDSFSLFFAGVVRTEVDGTVPVQASPVSSGDVGPWWYEVRALEAEIAARTPQLVEFAKMVDWLGKKAMLLPPAALRFRASLQSSDYGAPLRWYDPSGQVAVVLRTWRVRGDRVNTEWHSIVGADLLMRPDLLDVLFQVYGGGPLKELQRVFCRDINEQ